MPLSKRDGRAVHPERFMASAMQPIMAHTSIGDDTVHIAHEYAIMGEVEQVRAFAQAHSGKP
jgi:hypothetical protein